MPEKKGKSRSKKGARKTPRCKTCGKVIRVPAGWSVGPAARKHYWRHHRAIMTPRDKGRV